MALLASIDNSLNSGREALLGQMARTPDSMGLQSIFAVVAVLMIIMLFIQLRKGTEERKAMYGPFAILIFCGSMMFGFSANIIAWILVVLLMGVLSKKLMGGDWKGSMLILLVMYFMAYLLSVNTVMLLVMGGFVTVLVYFVRRANFKKVFGDAKASKLMKKEGYPVTKERRVLKKLRRIAGRGYSWSKDKALRSADKMKQRFARRALMNEAEQMREAEMAAAAENLSKTVYDQQKNLEDLEQRDSASVEQILRDCKQLKDYMKKLGDAVDQEKKIYITKEAHKILKQAHQLVRNHIEEDSLLEKGNKVIEDSMEVVHNSAHQATQLEESRRVFKELKKTEEENVKTLMKELERETKELKKSRSKLEHSKTEGSRERLHMIEQRLKGLEQVYSKLQEIDAYIKRINKLLGRINKKEGKRIEAMKNISEKAKKHAGKVHKEEKKFHKQSNELEQAYKKYKHISEKEEGAIADEELQDAIEGTLEMLKNLKDLAQTSTKYHEKELLPMMEQMAETTQITLNLSKTSQYLTNLYYRLAQADNQLLKMASIIDQNPEAKREFSEIYKEEGFEEKLIKRAYRRGKGVESHIKEGYRYLTEAYKIVQRHIPALRNYFHAMSTARIQGGRALNLASKKLLGQEIKQAKQLEKEAAQAEHRMAQAKRTEREAKATV